MNANPWPYEGGRVIATSRLPGGFGAGSAIQWRSWLTASVFSTISSGVLLKCWPVIVRAALTKCPSEAAGLSGRGGARVYRGGAFFGLVHDELGKAKGCSRWSSTGGSATPAMSRG